VVVFVKHKYKQGIYIYNKGHRKHMKSFKVYLLEDKSNVINKLKKLSSAEKKKLIAIFKEKPHLEDLKDKRGRPVIDWNNKNLTFNDFLNVISYRSSSEIKKAVKEKGIGGLKKGVDYLPVNIKDEYWVGYIPLTHEASVHIANNKIGNCVGKWCTAYKDKQYWIDYMIDNKLVPIYIIGDLYDMTGDKGWYTVKYAIVTTLDGKWQAFDQLDKSIYYISGSGMSIDKDIIKPNKSIIKKAQKIILKTHEDENDFIKDATTIDAKYHFNGSNAIWQSGIWKNGLWKIGNWFDGVWNTGTWEDGTWEDGEWDGGTWEKGIWRGGIWGNGTWLSGSWYGGTWRNGVWKNGVWRGGTWEGGVWYNGTWKNGTWRGGTWEGGYWEYGTWKNGVWKGGNWSDGVWRGGTWEGGTWEGGYDQNGDYHKAGDSPDKWEISK
jgi:hypothetical protein